MAGDWIKMRVDLENDPAVISIAEATGLPEDHVVGKLWKLWSWATTQTRDGNVCGVTEKWVDRYLNKKGFAKAMQKAGWLILEKGGLVIPKFDSHNSKSAKTRAVTKNRVSDFRNGASNASCNATVVTTALPEKRREEKKRERGEEHTESLSPRPGRASRAEEDAERSIRELGLNGECDQ